MQWSDIPFRPQRRMLRQFAGLLIGFGALAGLWHGWRHDDWVTPAVIVGVAAVIGVVGLVRPEAIRWLFVGWMIVVFPIGWVVSRVVLTLLYYGMVTPVALVFRLTGRDALALKPRPDAATYWAAKPQATDAARYLRQY
jgi:hypothetical protein